MLRDLAEPGDAGGFEFGVGIEAAGDGAVDDGLLLLVEQPDELALGADEAVDLPVRVVQKADDGELFFFAGDEHRDLAHCVNGQIPLTDAHTI
jgi:hypothetical protein